MTTDQPYNSISFFKPEGLPYIVDYSLFFSASLEIDLSSDFLHNDENI